VKGGRGVRKKFENMTALIIKEEDHRWGEKVLPRWGRVCIFGVWKIRENGIIEGGWIWSREGIQ